MCNFRCACVRVRPRERKGVSAKNACACSNTHRVVDSLPAGPPAPRELYVKYLHRVRPHGRTVARPTHRHRSTSFCRGGWNARTAALRLIRAEHAGAISNFQLTWSYRWWCSVCVEHGRTPAAGDQWLCKPKNKKTNLIRSSTRDTPTLSSKRLSREATAHWRNSFFVFACDELCVSVCVCAYNQPAGLC